MLAPEMQVRGFGVGSLGWDHFALGGSGGGGLI